MDWTIQDGPHEGETVHSPGNTKPLKVRIPFESGKFLAVYENINERLVLSDVEEVV
jgi:hypothetical protein